MVVDSFLWPSFVLPLVFLPGSGQAGQASSRWYPSLFEGRFLPWGGFSLLRLEQFPSFFRGWRVLIRIDLLDEIFIFYIAIIFFTFLVQNRRQKIQPSFRRSKSQPSTIGPWGLSNPNRYGSQAIFYQSLTYGINQMVDLLDFKVFGQSLTRSQILLRFNSFDLAINWLMNLSLAWKGCSAMYFDSLGSIEIRTGMRASFVRSRNSYSAFSRVYDFFESTNQQVWFWHRCPWTIMIVIFNLM